MRILIIEDEPRLAQAIKEGLEAEHYEAEVALSAEDGFFLAHAERFDLLILDLMLPGRSGLEALATLRQGGHTMPVLILSARDRVEDRIQGLDAGADDYLVKPFAFAELLARIRALIRRGRGEEPLRFKVVDLELDLVTRKVTRGDRLIELTAREFDLLAYLLRARGQVVSREMLARDVWHEVQRATPLDNVIDVHMVRLRRKVDDGQTIRLLHTLRGVGFMLSEAPP